MDSNLIESIAEATDIPMSPLAKVRLHVDNVIHETAASAVRRWDRTAISRRMGPLGRFIETRRHCGMSVLSDDPPVLLVPIGGLRPLWMIEALSPYLAGQRVMFLLLAYWSLEYESAIDSLRKNAEYHRRRFPNHGLLFLCNTAREKALLDAAGLDAVFLNQNQVVSERSFRPLDDETVTFDAVYNAKLARFKRHYLAAGIDRVLHIAYRCNIDMCPRASRAYVQRILTRSPSHQFANRLVNGLPAWLGREEVNRAYNRASVGLCLSPVEGAMYASVEYLLAGLPVVTTPSRGGRDHFFDPDFCITAEPDPRSVRDAVAALRDRAIPRSVIRERTLARIEAERTRGRSDIETAFVRHGFEPHVASCWPPKQHVGGVAFHSVRSHMANWQAHRRGPI